MSRLDFLSSAPPPFAFLPFVEPFLFHLKSSPLHGSCSTRLPGDRAAMLPSPPFLAPLPTYMRRRLISSLDVAVVLNTDILEGGLVSAAQVIHDKLHLAPVFRQIVLLSARVESLVLGLVQVHGVLEGLADVDVGSSFLPTGDGHDGDGHARIARAVADHYHRLAGDVKLAGVRLLEPGCQPAGQGSSVQVAEVAHCRAAHAHLLLQQIDELLILAQRLRNLSGCRERILRFAAAFDLLEVVWVHVELPHHGCGVCFALLAQLCKVSLVLLGGGAGKATRVQERHGLDGHHVVRAVEEEGSDVVVVLARGLLQALQHVLHSDCHLFLVHKSAVGAGEDREVGHLTVGRALCVLFQVHEVTAVRLTKVGATVVRSRAAVLQLHFEQLWVVLEHHGGGTSALCLLARGAQGVLRNVGRHSDRQAVLAISADEAGGALHRVHTSQTSVLELRHLAVARDGWHVHGAQTLIYHTFHNDGARRVVGGALCAEAEEADLSGVDVVVHDEVEHRVGGHGVRILVVVRNAEGLSHDARHFIPAVTRPLAPLFQVHAAVWGVHGHAADAREAKAGVAHHLFLSRYQSGKRRGGWGEEGRKRGEWEEEGRGAFVLLG
ncbi:hypothetical protein, conserved [Leishmania tarentolae]|uniref:Uncharacterized protein n=1 Tax=Leishmania tarentolae TaxID=5689 RepID=A0A640KJ35_LEITA|nr:hypothetical protein, conserved [Leishmania tarentolae]